jgi:hypothetical protein
LTNLPENVTVLVEARRAYGVSSCLTGLPGSTHETVPQVPFGGEKLPSEPLIQSLDFWLEQLQYSRDFKQWLRLFFNTEFLSEKEFHLLEEFLHTFQNKPEYLQKLLFLYSKPEKTLFFDAEVLEYERINTIPDLFQSWSGVFHNWIIELIDQIKEYSLTNKTFREKYEKVKSNNKNNFPIEKRVEAYLNGKYPLELIAEFDEIPVPMLKHDLLPFLFWGLDVYQAIYELKCGESEKKDYAKVPRWTDKNNAFLPFLGYAAITKDLDLLEKIFAEINICETINILAETFYEQDYRDNWLALAILDDFYKEKFNGYAYQEFIEINPTEKECIWLFLEFIGTRIKHDNSDSSLAIIQSFFLNRCEESEIKQSVINYLNYLFKIIDKKTFQKFAKKMTKVAASFSVNVFLAPEYFSYHSNKIIGGYVIDFLQYYLKCIKPGKDEIICVGQYLYYIIMNGDTDIQIHKNFLEISGFWNVCAQYIEDPDLILSLLSIPNNIKDECVSRNMWIDQVFAKWFLRKNTAGENDPVWYHYEAGSISKEAISIIETLLSVKVIYDEPVITEYIWDLITESDEVNHIKNIFLLAGYFARTNKTPKRDASLLNTNSLDIRVKNELNVMMYLKNHEKFDFIDFSLNHVAIIDIENFPEIVFDTNKTNFAELGMLFLRKKGGTYAEVREICHIIGRYSLFSNVLASIPAASLESYFEFFADKVLNENEEEFIGLFTFLEVYSLLQEKINPWLKGQTLRAAKIVDRCKKHLALLRKIEKLNINPEEENYFSATACLSAYLVSETGDYWKGIKPLLLAFRNSRKVLLNEKLYPLSTVQENIANTIYRLLSRKGDESKFKKLRQDMANEFCDYLKPLPARDSGDPEDRRDNYSKAEQRLEGFDLSYREPNPEWRYAYIRAIADLGVDPDGKGHLFHSILNRVAENDLSENVHDAAVKTAKQLKQIRGGWEDGSSHRILLQAFWWLRRAHMLSLQAHFDEKEALKTRNSEFRRDQ